LANVDRPLVKGEKIQSFITENTFTLDMDETAKGVLFLNNDCNAIRSHVEHWSLVVDKKREVKYAIRIVDSETYQQKLFAVVSEKDVAKYRQLARESFGPVSSNWLTVAEW
jgi:hypothetical protein